MAATAQDPFEDRIRAFYREIDIDPNACSPLAEEEWEAAWEEERMEREQERLAHHAG